MDDNVWTCHKLGFYSPKKQQVLTTDNMYENREQNISNFLLAKDILMLKILCAVFDQMPLLAYTKEKNNSIIPQRSCELKISAYMLFMID